MRTLSDTGDAHWRSFSWEQHCLHNT
jgi:hypothetical protein